jgi:hypothetical protein
MSSGIVGDSRTSTHSEKDEARDLTHRERRLTAVSALIAGALSFVQLVLLFAIPVPHDPAGRLSYIHDHQGVVAIVEIAVIVWATLSVPFPIALGLLRWRRSQILVVTATVLSASGILLLGFATYVGIGALWAIGVVGTPSTAGADAYQASVWIQLGYLLSDPPLMAWGIGQLLFAWLAWIGPLLPRWLAVVGGLSGLGIVLGSLALPSLAMLLIAVGILAFAIWALGIGVIMMRQTG